MILYAENLNVKLLRTHAPKSDKKPEAPATTIPHRKDFDRGCNWLYLDSEQFY